MVESALLLNSTLLPVVTWPETEIIYFLLNILQNNDLDQKYINYQNACKNAHLLCLLYYFESLSYSILKISQSVPHSRPKSILGAKE